MINRDIYKYSFTRANIPDWICPICRKGTLHTNTENFLVQDTADTQQNCYEEWFEPEYHQHTYSALFLCSNPKCKEPVANVGFGSYEEGYEETPYGIERTYIQYFKPLYFHPTLQFFEIPEQTPEEVKKAIHSSFTLFFSNKSAAANQVRIALECLLTHLKINQYATSKGRRKKLTLHSRIGLLPAKYQTIKDICLAIKWLGNAGSHCNDEMSFDDVFDGYDMLSFVLEELYDNKHTHVKRLAKKINAKKGV